VAPDQGQQRIPRGPQLAHQASNQRARLTATRRPDRSNLAITGDSTLPGHANQRRATPTYAIAKHQAGWQAHAPQQAATRSAIGTVSTAGVPLP
jgi:hypothetical protein